MNESVRTSRLVRFGEFEIDRQACELRRNCRRVALQIQSFRVLQILIDHAGEVVTRTALSAGIWPGTVYLDVDHGLNNAINRIRQALGDSGEDPRFIETLPRVGYRFIHAVEPRTTAQAGLPAASASRVPGWRAVATVVAVFLIGSGLVGIAHRAGMLTRSLPAAGIESRSSKIPEAENAYQRGIKFIAQRNKEALKLGIRQLQRATELDPEFASAHAALAEAYAGAGGATNSRYLNADEARGPALAAAQNALRLAPDLGGPHIALARVLDSLQPWSPATDLAIEQSYRHGLELDPGNADAHLQFGNFLAKRGRRDEAMSQFRRALELDPLSPSINSRLGEALMSAGAAKEGLDLLRKTVELDPFQFNARMRLGWGYLVVDDLDAAEQEFIAADRISPASVQSLSGQSFIAARRGDTHRARELLAQVLPLAKSIDDPLSVAIVYVGLRDREPALDWLSRTARETRALHRASPWSLQAPMYDWLRDDARFRQLEREIAASSGDYQRSDP